MKACRHSLAPIYKITSTPNYQTFVFCYLSSDTANKSKVLYGLLKEPELNVVLDDVEEEVLQEDGKPQRVGNIIVQ